MAKEGVRVVLKGPIAQGQSKAIFNEMSQAAIEELVSLGEQRLAKVLRPRPAGVFLSVSEAGKDKGSTGNYRRHLHTMVQGGVGVISDGKVVYGKWLEGISSRNQTTRFKGYMSFRKVGQWLNGKVDQVMRAHKDRLIRNLNGR